MGVVGGSYEIRITGRLSDAQLAEFEGLSVTTEPVETLLFGQMPDQDALHELLIKLQAVGLEVVEVRRLPVEQRQEPTAGPTGSAD
jgi:hypothetical protein